MMRLHSLLITRNHSGADQLSQRNELPDFATGRIIYMFFRVFTSLYLSILHVSHLVSTFLDYRFIIFPF